MRWKFALLLFLTIPLLLSPPARAQYPWSGILDPSRATDWSQAGIPGGIPNRTTICQTVTPSGDVTGATDRTNIQNAIEACGGKSQVVSLAAGTYYVKGLLFGGCPAPSNVTLRGAGPDKTILKFTGTVSCAVWGDLVLGGSEGWSGGYAGSTTWTGGYARGTSTITVGSASALSVGQIIILDQRDDDIGICPSSGGTGPCSGVAGATESGTTVTITTSLPHSYSANQCVAIGGVGVSNYNGWWTIASVPTSTTFTFNTGCNGNSATLPSGLASSGGGLATVDTGGVLFSANPSPAIIDEGGGIGRKCPDNVAGAVECSAGEISQRDQMELKRVTAINGNQITIDPPIEATNWRTSQNPGVWWTGPYATGDGTEDLTIDSTNDGCGTSCVSSTGGIVFLNAYESWLKNVRSVDGNRNHVWLYTSSRIDVTDSYFFGTKNAYTTSYGVEVYSGNSDDVIQNDICQHVVACVIMGGDAGSVASYNYMLDPGYTGANINIAELVSNHDFSAYDLFEGNDANGDSSDNTHGTSVSATFFRNRIRGQDTPLKTNYLNSVQDAAFNRAQNFIGNVLGTWGAQTTYQAESAGGGNGNVLEVGAQGENYNVPSDPLAATSLLRWGNYDVVTGAVRWCGNSSNPGWSTTCKSTSEIPTTGITFINVNPVPPSTSLPPSFYMATQPAWWKTAWGTPPWPAIGPDVTGGTAPDGVAGYSYAIPAQLCYENTPVDPAYQQSFTVSAAAVGSGTAGFNYDVTLTIGTNSLTTNDTVTVSGINPSGYNGTYQLLSTTSNTITYGVQPKPAAYTSGGSVTWPNILLYNAANCYPAAYNLPNPVTLTATPH